ncbi:WS/DGAT/MGAT family acyltransferase [Arthrobacter sp. SLBN-100]|nr:WS/DGAT/MGAT family acyltransferase [Arthrobacter sp. SLBN-100]
MGLKTFLGREGPERLSALDLSNLRVEDQGQPMHVAALAFLDAGPLLDPAGKLRLQDIRDHIDRRTHRSPRLRQHLVWPRPGLGPPFWADDPAFDVSRHVKTRQVPAPSDEESVLALCAELNQPALDRSRPLWEIWLLTGMAGNRAALLVRLHHALADGLAAQTLLAALFDTNTMAPEGKPPVTEEDPGQIRPSPRDRQLLAANVRDHWRSVARFASALARPRHTAMSAAAGLEALASVIRTGRAPAVSLNRPVGARRRLLLVRADFARIRAYAHLHDAGITDLLLTAYSEGCRQLLAARGELSPGLELKVSVAVSLRGSADSGEGNRVGVRVVPIPVTEPDIRQRLDRIAHTTSAQRRRPPYQPGGRVLQRWMARAMFHQRLVNLLMSNLPGPPAPVHFSGAEVLELFQIGVVQGNITLGLSVLTYAGQLNIAVVADADANPDVEAFGRGLSEALAQFNHRHPD